MITTITEHCLFIDYASGFSNLKLTFKHRRNESGVVTL